MNTVLQWFYKHKWIRLSWFRFKRLVNLPFDNQSKMQEALDLHRVVRLSAGTITIDRPIYLIGDCKLIGSTDPSVRFEEL